MDSEARDAETAEEPLELRPCGDCGRLDGPAGGVFYLANPRILAAGFAEVSSVSDSESGKHPESQTLR